MNVLIEALTSSKKYSRPGKALYSSGYTRKSAVQTSSPIRLTPDEAKTQLKQLQHEMTRHQASRLSPQFLSPPRKPFISTPEYPSLFTEGHHLETNTLRSQTPAARRHSLKASFLSREAPRTKAPAKPGASLESPTVQTRGVAFKKQSLRKFLPLHHVNDQRFLSRHVETELHLKFKRVASTKFRSINREKGSDWQQVMTYALSRSPQKPPVDPWVLRYIRSQSRL